MGKGRILIALSFALAMLWAVAAGALFGLMLQPPERFARAVSRLPQPVLFGALPFQPLWSFARGGRLAPGDRAPDFDLPTADGRERVRLSSFRGRMPVVLIFGSYTSPPFRRELPALNRMYQRFRDRAVFYVVYILEAHASDVWQAEINERQQIVVASPRTFGERTAIAAACVRNLHIEIPAVLDNFQNTTERAYSAWPDRMYLIDAAGRVAYKSRPGPFGFRPQEAAAKLENVVVPAAQIAAR